MELLTRGSVSCWLEEARNGDSNAAQQLWDRYFSRLVAIARARLDGNGRVADEEDVASRALSSLLMGIQRGKFPQLHDRTGLWPLLVTIVARNSLTELRWRYAQCRSPRAENSHFDLSSLVDDEPTPEFALELTDQIEHLVRQLSDPTYHDLARWKLKGFTNEQIAQKMGISTFTVYRKLRILRRQWGASEDE